MGTRKWCSWSSVGPAQPMESTRASSSSCTQVLKKVPLAINLAIPHPHSLLSHTIQKTFFYFFFPTMAGVNPEAVGWKAYPSVMETALASSGDGRRDHNMNDDGSVMHFSATRPVAVPSSGQNKVIPSPTQFSILYKGKMCIYEGIPAEKVREIMLIASVSAKSAEMKSGIPLTSFIPKSPSSQGNSTNLPSPQSVKSSIRRLQDEFPLARRQSLQRFLEKRRNRETGSDCKSQEQVRTVFITFGQSSIKLMQFSFSWIRRKPEVQKCTRQLSFHFLEFNHLQYCVCCCSSAKTDLKIIICIKFLNANTNWCVSYSGETPLDCTSATLQYQMRKKIERWTKAFE